MQSENPPPRRKKKDTDPISAAIRNARRSWAAQIETLDPVDEPRG